MGAHVSACPNKKTKRVFPWETRAAVAMHGTFGYELDPAKMTEEELEICQKQTEIYRKNQQLIFGGDYYRLSAPNDGDIFSAWEFVSKDKTHSLVFAVTEDISILDKNYYVKVQGLDPDKSYKVEGNGCNLTLSGKALEKIGLLIPHTVPPFTTFIFELTAI
jgi:alpha-galactosidase